MKQRWYGLLPDLSMDEFPGRRGFNVGLLEKIV
jgi:hypothetical protein